MRFRVLFWFITLRVGCALKPRAKNEEAASGAGHINAAGAQGLQVFGRSCPRPTSPPADRSAVTRAARWETPRRSAPRYKHGKSEYIAFVLVPVFFLLGLLGVLICHILKRKGYRCTTEAEDNEELEKVEDEEEKDLEKGANSDALNAMVQDSIDSEGGTVTPTTPNSPTGPESPALPGLPPSTAKHTCNHLHTIGGVGGYNKNICNRCNQKKWPLMRRSSSKRLDSHRKSHIGEVTVLSVGRFRVTKCDPKIARDRKTLLITETKGSVPSSPASINVTEKIVEPQEKSAK
ncbi:hypothetical protein DNTS_031988 [Danionella cerebrum]|uniref:RELT-like protein 1 n=1 Tax=Danionella cerebrum TaxID=2873325 RepID=A0A553PYL1_9TELE|nr:hypothetical protein DNTS_031988 [Danionella translucida]